MTRLNEITVTRFTIKTDGCSVAYIYDQDGERLGVWRRSRLEANHWFQSIGSHGHSFEFDCSIKPHNAARFLEKAGVV